MMSTSVLHMLNYCLSNLLLPSKVEQWVNIIDLEGVALSSIPINGLRSFLSVSQNTFRSRAAKAYVLNAGWVLSGSWYIVSAMLDETSRAKVQFLGHDYKDVLIDQIGRENLEQRFGGNVPNKKDKFFPPEMNVDG